MSQGVGPGVGAVMFYLSGNVWKLEVMQVRARVRVRLCREAPQ